MNTGIKVILNTYKGLRKEDLCEMNPDYSCVICGKSDCPHLGETKKCCPEHEAVSIRDFVKRYNFS